MSDLRKAISDAYLADEETVTAGLIRQARLSPGERAGSEALARELVTRIRAARDQRSGVDAFTQEYALSSEEGVVLMCLAESLLRVPDAATADKLIRDKIGSGDWSRHMNKSDSLFVNASTFALMLTGRVVRLDETARWDFEGIWKKLVTRSGEPVIRNAVTFAMRILGRQFVLGRTIEEALKRAREQAAEGYRFSFDMLGEAAYTKHDAARYYDSYRHALAAIAREFPDLDQPVFERPSISVKLSALHPRYEWIKRERVMTELLPQLVALGAEAREANLALTIDAEEAERLDLMLDVFEAMGEAAVLRGWSGLGLAVQAYQKRALPVIAWLADLARRQDRRIPVRLVKGAYWDTEIKRAQELGLPDFPVFTRKSATDTSYLAAARALFGAGEAIYPQFATHNAHTLSAVQVFADGRRDFEYQRLHGMGEALYELYREVKKPSPGAGTRIYAPVGTHEDLLAYLVRRLLENGANTSFVNRLADEDAPIEDIIGDPVEQLASKPRRRSATIPKPGDLFSDRKNSSGFLWSDPQKSAPMLDAMRAALRARQTANPIVAGSEPKRESHPVFDPADRTRQIGDVAEVTEDDVRNALETAARAQHDWDGLGGEARAKILERAADLFQQNGAQLMALAVREGGKTLPNALGELREAVDLLRYYAAQAREKFERPIALPGPTGETNELSLHGRGPFFCVAPWNFPLAIFSGQVAGALAAGDTVLAKPAERTPLIAAAAVRLMHQAGVPGEVLHLLPGRGSKIGRVVLADPRLAGIAFTGSTETAVVLNRALAARDGALPAIVAETGGMNCMIVDSTALAEQVARDVNASAFDSAGQRCSALRVLFLQDDVADRMLEFVLGAMDELKLGDPFDLSTDIGPVIDEDARKGLQEHADRMTSEAKLLRKLPVDPSLASGVFFPPHAFAIQSISQLKREVFGPILHVVRYSADRLGEVCEAINATGYGLTLGVHSRIEATADFVRRRVQVGNIYVNRNQIGAVVGVQPFGGEGLSGTGPKAGGPHYLFRFALERTYTVNTTAAGGNASLLAGDSADGI
ncbi:MAG TPA: bifunctional proline dehydrogenase/L-glutamate gamma-semialdehyde dehydrogenase PutA [Rhizomicrobium sp.]|jgi:RHH-type proline utilization regulon transcriptional repressor/proline dehydrogenase/delta 1-pyrroline-5-carboxylate dehydrogenase